MKRPEIEKLLRSTSLLQTEWKEMGHYTKLLYADNYLNEVIELCKYILYLEAEQRKIVENNKANLQRTMPASDDEPLDAYQQRTHREWYTGRPEGEFSATVDDEADVEALQAWAGGLK